LRYLTPSSGGYANTTLPYPVVFWACDATSETFKPKGNPFDRTGLGYDALFNEGTIFYHVDPVTATAVGGTKADTEVRLALDVRVPVLDLEKAWYVEGVTGLIVALGVTWVLWKSFGPLKTIAGRSKKSEKVRKA